MLVPSRDLTWKNRLVSRLLSRAGKWRENKMAGQTQIVLWWTDAVYNFRILDTPLTSLRNISAFILGNIRKRKRCEKEICSATYSSKRYKAWIHFTQRTWHYPLHCCRAFSQKLILNSCKYHCRYKNFKLIIRYMGITYQKNQNSFRIII